IGFITCTPTPSAVCAQNQPQLTVDELIAKNVAAKGRADAVRSLKSVRLTGKLLVNEGQIQLAYVETKKRPGAIRDEVTLQGMTAIQAYDGAQGWKVSPFQGRKDPEKMSADDTKPLMEDAEIEGPLIDWKIKGSTVEYLGTEDVDGTQAHKLKVVRKNGDVTFVYLDPDHFLEIRTVTLFILGAGIVAAEDAPFNSATISGLGARNIGSATMSGRISAIAGTREPSGKITLFVGAASGGVWKSDDSGTRYRPVFDEQPVQSIGAIALDPKNAKNVWVGTGESWTRNSVSIGDGIYKSTDGGETWTH